MPAFIIYISCLVLLAIVFFMCYKAAWLYRQARDLNPDRETRDSLKEQIRVANETKASLLNNIDALQGELATAKKEIQDANAARKFLQDNKDTVANLNAEIATAKTSHKEIVDQLNKRQEELQEINQKLQSAQQEKAAIDQDNAAKKVEKSELETKLSQLLPEYKELVPKVERLRTEAAHLQSVIDEGKKQLEEQKSQQTSFAKKQEDMRSEISDKEREIREKNAQLAGIDVKLSADTAKLDEVENRWQDLERPWQTETRKARNLDKITETKWLQEFEKNLQNHNIIFNKRTIRSFHTGLKVTDISPIVILAGVSGTGKSLLPRLYATALGMNFLQVAVQPRWDSPQDMLGFYNFMERRFKATEFSRLLWQYDIFNNGEAEKTYKKAEKVPMNMVLLDEMNLARVEYYFSDLLSKLEVRRGIDLKDKQKRRAAEIEIECGAQERKAQSRYIFPGFNTLFVGTMNEDESTQTLSDKVMDRANVIRFGKPSKLNVQPNLEGFFKNCASSDEVLLPTGDTCLWKQNNQGKVLHDLQDIMDPINDALAEVGRPFAHRVWQAMSEYVEQYPNVDENEDASRREAIADQVEMKILPKLNGLEKERPEVVKALDVMQSSIEKLKDQELFKAFDKACKTDGIFFQWRGVMR